MKHPDLVMMFNSFYDNIDPRRRQEVADSRMIQEDHDAMANLSPRAIHQQFDSRRFNQSPWSDDEIGGL